MGIGKPLTSVGASEVLSEGRVPYSCIVVGNVRSMRRALSAGFFPPWVDICATLDAALRVSERSLGSAYRDPGNGASTTSPVAVPSVTNPVTPSRS